MEDLLHQQGFFGELFERRGVVSYHIQILSQITGFVTEGATQSPILSLELNWNYIFLPQP